MKSELWYFFLFCFQVEVLMGEINNSAKYVMFAFYNGSVQVSCRYPETVQQFKMQLLRGEQVLCDLMQTTNSENMVSVKALKFCEYQLLNNSVSFFLYNLDSSYAGYYFCKLSIFDPPPFQVETLKEYLHIYELQHTCQLKFWLPIGCAAFVIVYIFGCMFIFWFTKKKYQSSVHDPNSEYMFMAAVNTAKKTRPAEPSGTRA